MICSVLLALLEELHSPLAAHHRWVMGRHERVSLAEWGVVF